MTKKSFSYKNKSDSYYKNLAKKLKAANVFDIDLRLKLDKKSRASITRNYNRFKSMVNYPKSNTIKYIDKKEARKFKESGYLVFKREKNTKYSVIIKHDDGATVNIKRGVVRIDTGSRIYEEYPAKRIDIFSRAKELEKVKLNRNQYITGKIGGNSMFRYKRFDSVKDFMRYVTDKFGDNSEVLEMLTIVTVVNQK